jgi:peptide chain release factor 1
VEAYHKWESISDDLAAAREMAAEDPDFAAEVPELEEALRLRGAAARLLIPRDPGRCPQRDP